MSLLEPQPVWTDDNEPRCQERCHYFDPRAKQCDITGDKVGDKCTPELVQLRRPKKPIDPTSMMDWLTGKVASIDATLNRESDAGIERDHVLAERMGLVEQTLVTVGDRLGSLERRQGTVEGRIVKMDESADARHQALTKALRDATTEIAKLHHRLSKTNRDSQTEAEKNARADADQDARIEKLEEVLRKADEAANSASAASQLATHASARSENAALAVETHALRTVAIAKDLESMIPTKNRRLARTIAVVIAVIMTMGGAGVQLYTAIHGR